MDEKKLPVVLHLKIDTIRTVKYHFKRLYTIIDFENPLKKYAKINERKSI